MCLCVFGGERWKDEGWQEHRIREVGAVGRAGAGEETRMKTADGRW